MRGAKFRSFVRSESDFDREIMGGSELRCDRSRRVLSSLCNWSVVFADKIGLLSHAKAPAAAGKLRRAEGFVRKPGS